MKEKYRTPTTSLFTPSPQPHLTSRATPSKIADDRPVNSSQSNQSISRFGKKSKEVKNK